MAVQPFIHQSHAARVVFGTGALEHLAREVAQLGAQRVLVLSTPAQQAQAQDAASRLGERAVGVFAQAAMHVPAAIARQACEYAAQVRADATLAFGGGSTIGLAKAIALETGLPILAVPTTYAGSEMTPIYGITDGGLKKTGRDLRVLPRVVIYDPDLTLGLPTGLSITSALNAMAHAAEGLYAQDSNPVTSLMAEEGLRALGQAIPALSADPQGMEARETAQYGAWLCGSVLGSVGMALHHKLCHTLGGSFNLPHAETHCVVLPHALAYNAQAAPRAMERIARALSHDDAPSAVFNLARAHGAPTSLRELGMAEADLDRAAALACQNAYWNPQPLTYDAIRALLGRAWAGEAPQAGA